MRIGNLHVGCVAPIAIAIVLTLVISSAATAGDFGIRLRIFGPGGQIIGRFGGGDRGHGRHGGQPMFGLPFMQGPFMPVGPSSWGSRPGRHERPPQRNGGPFFFNPFGGGGGWDNAPAPTPFFNSGGGYGNAPAPAPFFNPGGGCNTAPAPFFNEGGGNYNGNGAAYDEEFQRRLQQLNDDARREAENAARKQGRHDAEAVWHSRFGP